MPLMFSTKSSKAPAAFAQRLPKGVGIGFSPGFSITCSSSIPIKPVACAGRSLPYPSWPTGRTAGV